jgi:hypothetical protein
VLRGAISLLLWHKRWTMSLATRAVVTAGTAPVVEVEQDQRDALAPLEHVQGGQRPARQSEISASFAWAIAPHDALSASELLDCADQRLLYRKRLNKTAF